MRRIVALIITIVFFQPVPNSVFAKPVHGQAMHGKVKYKNSFKHFDYVNPNAPKGGNVKLATTGSFDNFNNFIIKGEAAAGLGN